MGRVSEAQVEQIVAAWSARNARTKARAVLADLIASTPVDTGDARRRWRIVRETRRGLVYEIVISNDSDHIGHIIHGHGVIRPVRAKVLHWRDRGGADVFAREVGPVPPNPFIDEVLSRQSDRTWRFRRRR